MTVDEQVFSACSCSYVYRGVDDVPELCMHVVTDEATCLFARRRKKQHKYVRSNVAQERKERERVKERTMIIMQCTYEE